jgi:N-acetyl-beta-hexosaminidase
MAEQKLPSINQVHGYFMKRMADHCKARGRRLIGWDEIAQAGYLDPTTAVMIWQSTGTARSLVERGHDVVLTPMSHCYFDFGEPGEAAAAEQMANVDANGDRFPSALSPTMARCIERGSRFPLPNAAEMRLAGSGLSIV